MRAYSTTNPPPVRRTYSEDDPNIRRLLAPVRAAIKETYSAGATRPEIAEEVARGIALVTLYNSPLLAYLGFPDGLKETRTTNPEWVEDALNANSTTLTGTHTSVATTINVATGTGTRFAAGELVQVEGSREIMSVSTVAASALTVARGFGGTTAEAYTAGQTVKRLSRPYTETAAAPTANSTNRTRQAAYTQLFIRTAGVTDSDRRALQLGDQIEDELDYQTLLNAFDLQRDLAMSVYRGAQQSSNPEGTTAQARTMRGIIEWILAGSDPASVDASNAALSEELLRDVAEECYTRGGTPSLIVTGTQQRRALTSLFDSRQRFPVENTILGAVVERVVTDFGTFDVLRADAFCPADVVLLLDPSRIRFLRLGPSLGQDEIAGFWIKPLGNTSLATQLLVTAEFSLEIKNAVDGGHGLLQNLSF